MESDPPERARDADALPLTARELNAALTDGRIVALRQAADELIAVGVAGGRNHLVVGGVGAPVADVSHHRPVE